MQNAQLQLRMWHHSAVRLGQWGILGETAELLVGTSEINPEAVAFCLLALVGAELSDRLPSSERLDRHNLNLFVLLVGPSGVSRKSSAMSAAASFWRAFCSPAGTSPENRSPYIVEGVGSGEGLARLLDGGSDESPRRVCLLYDESAQFAAKASIDGSSLSFIFNSLYDGRSWENQVKASKHSARVDNAVLSFIGAATPEIYEHLWTSQGISLGTLNRFLLVSVPPSDQALFWPGFPDNDRKGVVGAAWRMRLAHMDHLVEWPAAAKDRCQQWYEGLDRSQPETARIDDLVKRLLALNCWCRDVHAVDSVALDECLEIANEQIAYRKVWWQQTNPMTHRIEEALRGGNLSNRELYRFLNAHRNSQTFTQALDALEKAGVITKVAVPDKSGKVGWSWRLTEG